MGIGTQELPHPRQTWHIDGKMTKGESLAHDVDLAVQTKGIHKEMRFLLTDLREEDLILGYPWLANFEPKVTWKTATIDTTALPIVIRTVNPRIEQIMPVIARALTEPEKWNIVHELANQSTIRTTATDLAIRAKQYTTKTEVPVEDKKHAKVFNKEEAQRFHPSR